MSAYQSQRVIVVLGMHRSGTSAITRALRLFGVGLGSDLYPAGFDNPTGFWEDRQCIEINEALLSYCKSEYHKLGLVHDILTSKPIPLELKQRAQAIVARQLQENDGIWGFKDPRTCRLLPFWQMIFDSIGCEVSYVVALRNPLSVAFSLNTRNQIAFEKACFLWLQHVIPAIVSSEGSPRVVVDYDRFIDAPLGQLTRIAKTLDLPVPEGNSAIMAEFIQDFLDKSLRHSKFSMADLEDDPRVPFDAVSVYRILLHVAADELDVDDPEVKTQLNDVHSRLMAYAAAFSYVNALEDERTSLYRILDAHAAVVQEQ